jgi:hypothetical protein
MEIRWETSLLKERFFPGENNNKKEKLWAAQQILPAGSESNRPGRGMKAGHTNYPQNLGPTMGVLRYFKSLGFSWISIKNILQRRSRNKRKSSFSMDFHVPVLLRIPQGFSSLFCEIKKGGGRWKMGKGIGNPPKPVGWAVSHRHRTCAVPGAGALLKTLLLLLLFKSSF